MGISAEKYAKQLIEEGLSLEQQARSTPFDELFAPVQKRFEDIGMSEEDLDLVVNAARKRRRQTVSRTARKSD